MLLTHITLSSHATISHSFSFLPFPSLLMFLYFSPVSPGSWYEIAAASFGILSDSVADLCRCCQPRLLQGKLT